MDALLRELERLYEYVNREPSFSAAAQRLESLLRDGNKAYTIGIAGADVGFFLNGLLDEEIFPQDMTIGTSAVIKMRHGEKIRLLGMFKTGNTREYDLELLQMLPLDGGRAGSFFQTNLEYLVLETPCQPLKDVTLLLMPEGADDEQRGLLYEQLDDIVWLFRNGIETLLPAEPEIAPVGIMMNMPLDASEAVSTQEQEEVGKKMRDVLYVSRVPERNYGLFIQYIEQSIQNPVQRKKRFLRRIQKVLEELLVSFQVQLGNPQYTDHRQRIVEFINEGIQKLDFFKASTITEIQKQEEEIRKWDFFSKDITTLQQLYDRLKAAPLSTDHTKILPFLSDLFTRIAGFKRSVENFEEVQREAWEQYQARLGHGIGKWRHLFAGKEVLKEMERLSRSVEQKHLACRRWKEEIEQSQQRMKGRLRTALMGIEQEVYKKRGQLVQRAYDAKQKYVSRMSVQLSQFEASYESIERYMYMHELQRYLRKEFLPFLKEWGKKDTETSPFLFKIAHIVARIGEYDIPIGAMEEYQDRIAALQLGDIWMPESAELPYRIQDKVPLEICEEFRPIVPQIRQMKYMYVRPYVVTILFMLFIFVAYEISSKVIPPLKKIETNKAAPVQRVKQNDTGTIPTAKITTERLVVRNAPNVQAKQIDLAVRGELYTIHRKQNGWIEIGENEWIMAGPNDVAEGEIGSAAQ